MKLLNACPWNLDIYAIIYFLAHELARFGLLTDQRDSWETISPDFISNVLAQDCNPQV